MPQKVANHTLNLKFPRSAEAARLLKSRRRLVAALQEVWRAHRGRPAVIEVVFVNEATICKLHEEFLGDPSPTDVITFDLGATPDQRRLGSLYICPAVARQHAARFKAPFAEEIRRLIIHGLLHLLGYDDTKPAQRRRMRERENQILRIIHSRASSPLTIA